MRLHQLCLCFSLCATAPGAMALYQTLPTSPPLRISGFNVVTTDLVSGLKIPDGPIVNPAAGALVKYGPPSTYAQLATRSNTLVAGGANVGTLTDFVFRDSTDNRLVFGLRVVLEQNVNGQPNVFEINDFFRKGSTGFTVQAAWSRASDSDLRMYAAVRTAVKFGQGTETFDPDTVKFQSDINTSEGNPRSGYFFLKSNAPNFKTLADGLSVYQGGEEGQSLLEIKVPGFVPSANPDNDGDGYDAGVDCNDNDPAINPGATETCGDGIDNNCANGIDEAQFCLSVEQVPFVDTRALGLLGVIVGLLAVRRLRMH